MTSEPRSPQSDELRRIVAECLDLLETHGDSAVDEICRRYPQHETAIRQRIRNLKAMGLVGPVGAAEEEKIPERLGEFRLLRRLGSGGMGVVYLAVQEGLGREVALKLVRPEQLFFPGARERFRREVESIAKVQHPGIVPVHTVGEENGIPYFAMERVLGCTLADALNALQDGSWQGKEISSLTGRDLFEAVLSRTPEGSDLPESAETSWVFEGSYADACLRIVRQAAEALDHAHRRGILHRDMKPSNLMITPSGRVMLLDFGLASSTGGATSALTRTGANLGSLPYMSPEQLQGDFKALDARADIYALGVTLYEMLALRSPYLNANAEITRKLIEQGKPAPLRTLNRSISWDAETVCLKAMDRDRERRYASASDFARDLENVLDRRPIEGRRASLLLRARRWTQRRPAAAMGLAAATLLTVGGPILYGLWERDARQRIEEALNQTREAKALAEKNYARALAAVQGMREIGEKKLASVPQAQTIRAEILDQAIGFYRGFLEDRAGDASLREEVVRAQGEIAELFENLGRGEQSIEEHRKRESMARALLASDPQNESYAQIHAESVTGLASVLEREGKRTEAGELFRKSLEEIEPLVSSKPANASFRMSRALTLAVVGGMLRQEGKIEEGESYLTRSIEDFDFAREAGLTTRGAQIRESWAWNELAQTRRDLRKYEDAEKAHREAIALRQALVASEPNDQYLRLALGQSQINFGYLLNSREKRDEAMTLLEQAVGTFRSLAADFPDVPIYGNGLQAAAMNLAGTHHDAHRIEEAERFYRIALEAAKALSERNPRSMEYAASHANAVVNLSRIYFARDDASGALIQIENGLRLLEPALKDQPKNTRFLDFLAVAKVFQAKAHLALGHEQEMFEALDQLPKARLPMETGVLRNSLSILGEFVAKASAASSTSEIEREARVAKASQYAAALCERLDRIGFTSWSEVWAVPEIAVFRDRAEIPAKFKPGS